MEIIRQPNAMTSWSDEMRDAGRSICLVSTMGFFHEGHLALMRKGSEIADEVVVSLFVNPMQFGPQEDLSSYPRVFEKDAAMAREVGVAVMFAPAPEDVYAPGFQSRVEVDGLTEQLCGRSRPGHFRGVTTVVAKLFNMVKPHFAVFGEKDFQQLAVLRRMTVDLNFDLQIIGHPIVREQDGLAMSSRNSYLDEEERRQALSLHQALLLARQMVVDGERDAVRLQEELGGFFKKFDRAEVDYVAVVDSENLNAATVINEKSLLVLAVRIGKTRLIDNTLLMG